MTDSFEDQWMQKLENGLHKIGKGELFEKISENKGKSTTRDWTEQVLKKMKSHLTKDEIMEVMTACSCHASKDNLLELR